MGRYLEIGIATGIYVRKKRYGWFYKEDTFDEIKAHLSKSTNLDLYDYQEDENNVYFLLKKDIFEKNFESFLRKEYEYMELDKEEYKVFDEIKKLKYDELISKLRKGEISYQYCHFAEFGYDSNSINYLCSKNNDVDIYVDMISFLGGGKIIFECYGEIFRYLRRKIIDSIDNPLKDTIFITIFG